MKTIQALIHPNIKHNNGIVQYIERLEYENNIKNPAEKAPINGEKTAKTALIVSPP